MPKTLTIKEDVYRKLLSLKREQESFSDLFERLAEREGGIGALKKFAGSVEISDDERAAILKEIESRRWQKRTR